MYEGCYLKRKALSSWDSVEQKGLEEHAAVRIPVVLEKSLDRWWRVNSGVVAVEAERVIGLETKRSLKVYIMTPKAQKLCEEFGLTH